MFLWSDPPGPFCQSLSHLPFLNSSFLESNTKTLLMKAFNIARVKQIIVVVKLKFSWKYSQFNISICENIFHEIAALLIEVTFAVAKGKCMKTYPLNFKHNHTS